MDTRTSQRTGGPYAGTTFYEDRGPSVDDMPWCTSYTDVEHVFRSKDWVQGGGGARDSCEFIGDGLLALSGADHFQRRADLVTRFERGELAEDELPLGLITVMIRNPDHFLRSAPGVCAADAILFHGGPVNSVAKAIPHTVMEDEFNPYRGRNKGVKSKGIAFGGGVHTCIAIRMTIGDASRAGGDSAAQAGLMVACLRELYQRGMRPDSENVPKKSGADMRDEYASCWVVSDK